jgi:tRNA (guanine37-N1)-methyltransferase
VPFNKDGRVFIRESSKQLLQEDIKVDITPKSKISRTKTKQQPVPAPPRVHLTCPKTFQHYVMNLPASALTFLDAFIGVYKGEEKLFEPYTRTKLPMVHVHCFSTKSDDNKREKVEICKEISRRLDYQINYEQVNVWDVRDVAPKKRMFCASFRLPPGVAFRE